MTGVSLVYQLPAHIQEGAAVLLVGLLVVCLLLLGLQVLCAAGIRPMAVMAAPAVGRLHRSLNEQCIMRRYRLEASRVGECSDEGEEAEGE